MIERRKKLLEFFSIVFFILGIISLIICSVLIVRFFSNSTKSTDSVADGFTIESYEVNLDVDSNNKIHVTEDINVNFYEDGHHGIFRFIPEWLKYTSKNNKTMSRRAKITNLECKDENYEVDSIHGKERIKIGSSYYTLDPGNYEYEISYDYDMGGDIYKGFDEFIFHAFGDYWGTEIKGAKVNITLPEDIDSASKVLFFADKKRKKDITSQVNYTVDGNTITAVVSKDYQLNGALTVDVELPDGYFIDARVNYKSIAFILCSFCFISLLISFFFWNKNKDSDLSDGEHVAGVVPGGLEAVEMGYIYGGRGQLLLVTVIIQLAGKGYIRIKNPSSKKNLKIIKVNTSVSNMTDAEKLVYEGLFKNGNEVNPVEDKNVRKLNDKLCKMLEAKIDPQIYNITSYVEFFISSVLFFVSSVAWGFAYIMAEDMDSALRWLFWPAFVAIIVTGFFAAKTPKKTAYGIETQAAVETYKDYLSNIHKKDLEAKIKENPDYFDEILPYAFILGISKALVKKYDFEANVTNRYRKYTDNLTSAIYYGDTNTGSGSSSSGSGCSSCGGGCSSCGGGCSSCGGGGSW